MTWLRDNNTFTVNKPEIFKCANCGKPNTLDKMAVTMVCERERYVCNLKCMLKLYWK